MTTNVLDLHAGIAAADSRWSSSSDDGLLMAYADDVGFEKIMPFYHLLLVFAGSGELIQQWKDWLLHMGAEELPPTDAPPNRTISVTVTNIYLSALLFECRQIRCKEQYARFAGSGGIHAYRYWLNNGDARMAVQYATSMDVYSGGTTKYFKFDTRENNLHETIRVNKVNAIIYERDHLMDFRTKQTVSLKEAAKQDEEVARFAERIKSGEARVETPGMGPSTPWTNEERQELYRVLQREIAKIKD